MFKRGQIALAMVVIVGLMLAACAPAAPAPAAPAAQEAAPAQEAAVAPKGEPVDVGGTATGVPYEMKESLYGGKPLKLTIWDWHTPRINYWNAITPKYTKMYPNVTFEIVQVGGEDYWKKLMAAIPAGQGPDIFHFHNAQHTPFTQNNLIDPFPEDLFVPSYYRENYVGMAEGHFMDKEGRIRYLPYGSMAADIYVNKKMWDEAGLTENDIPKTWEDLVAVAKKLTKYDAAGNIDVAGFAFNGYIQYLWNDMNFQQGRYMYTKDGRGCQVDTPEGKKSLELIKRMYDEKINSPEFLEYIEAFGTQKAAMAWVWTWFSGYMEATYPDVEFFTFRMPSFTGENLPALGRQNYEVSLTVNPQLDVEKRKAAWDFLHWVYSDDEKLVDLALMHAVAPAYKKLFNHPRIVANPTIADLAQQIEFKVFPGEFPGTMDTALTQYIGQNIVAGTSIDQSLQEAQQACDAAMQEQEYWVVERTYIHDDAMIPNQP
jgi:multiple sugar transport system substrate-binding protein